MTNEMKCTLQNVSLTHLPHVLYICAVNWVSIVSDNGLLPVWHQAITYTNAGSVLMGTLRTDSSEILIKIQNFSFMEIHLKMSSVKWQPFCPGGDELISVAVSILGEEQL